MGIRHWKCLSKTRDRERIAETERGDMTLSAEQPSSSLKDKNAVI